MDLDQLAVSASLQWKQKIWIMCSWPYMGSNASGQPAPHLLLPPTIPPSTQALRSQSSHQGSNQSQTMMVRQYLFILLRNFWFGSLIEMYYLVIDLFTPNLAKMLRYRKWNYILQSCEMMMWVSLTFSTCGFTTSYHDMNTHVLSSHRPIEEKG